MQAGYGLQGRWHPATSHCHCPHNRGMPPVSARVRIASIFETFEEFGAELRNRDPIGFSGYLEAISTAETTSGEKEAVVTGLGTIDGRMVAAAIFEFGFLGGSMGEAAGEKTESAMHRAIELKRPFLAVTSTGGARMQEGMAALAQMPRTVAASLQVAAEGLPRITVLAHPTTGGVYASFASLADVLIAETGATIGFAGPRVAQALSGAGLREGSHTAQAAFEAGLVDAVVEPEDLKQTLSNLIRILEPAE